MIEECYQKAEKILTENMNALVLIAETLKERESIDAKEFFALMEGKDDVFEEVDRIEKERYQQTPAEEKLPGDEVVPEDPIEKKEE